MKINKMKTTKQYETEKKVVKGVFWMLLVLFLMMFVPPFFFKVELCHWYPCYDIYTSKILFMYSLMFFPLSPIFFMKEYYNKWKVIIIFTVFLTYLNLKREDIGDDFFMIGPYTTTVYIYIMSTLISCILLYKQKNENNK